MAASGSTNQKQNSDVSLWDYLYIIFSKKQHILTSGFQTHSSLSLFLLTVSAGCQVCGGEEEAAAGLPSHGDEQTDPDAARVHGPAH